MGRREDAIRILQGFKSQCSQEDAKMIGKLLRRLRRGDITEDMLKDMEWEPPAALLGGLEDLIATPAWDASGTGTLVDKLEAVPTPSKFGDKWQDFSDSKEHGAFFNNFRPDSARGIPAALAYEGFGIFMDNVDNVELDDESCDLTLQMTEQMSKTYANSSTLSVLKVTQEFFGPKHKGEARGGEKERARRLRSILKEMADHLAPGELTTLTPTAVDKAQSETDGSWCVLDQAGEILCHVLMLEVKEDFGGGGNPMMQLLAYYAKVVASQWKSAAVQQTCFPALAVEVYGNNMRIHALFTTDKVCIQPLTPMLHLSDMRGWVPGYTEVLARTLKALVWASKDLKDFYKPYQVSSLSSSATMDDHDPKFGLPYMLRDRFKYVEKLHPHSHVYLCKDEGQALVAKLVERDKYAVDLHKELDAKGLAPKLLHDIHTYPGGFMLVEMEYLDPDDGWQRLDGATAHDFTALSAACTGALRGLQQCLGGHAVHGDLRACNIYVRAKPSSAGDGGYTSAASSSGATSMRRVRGQKTGSKTSKTTKTTKSAPGASSEGNGGAPEVAAYEVKFVDFDWGGREGEACYPPFINFKQVQWPVKGKVVGQLILQQHDTDMLKASLSSVLQGSHPVGAGGAVIRGARGTTCAYIGGAGFAVPPLMAASVRCQPRRLLLGHTVLRGGAPRLSVPLRAVAGQAKCTSAGSACRV